MDFAFVCIASSITFQSYITISTTVYSNEEKKRNPNSFQSIASLKYWLYSKQ